MSVGVVPRAISFLRRPWAYFGLILFLTCAWQVHGQADQGSITGIITDSQHAVVQGATVTITNLDTQFQLKTTTDASGVYVFSPIKVGQYAVSAMAPGFATTKRDSVRVDVDQRVGVNLALQVGQVTKS